MVLRASTAFALSTGDRDRDCDAGVVVKSHWETPGRHGDCPQVNMRWPQLGDRDCVGSRGPGALRLLLVTGWPKIAGNIPV